MEQLIGEFMRKDITICIGTVGYPTFNRCKSIINRIKKAITELRKLLL